jgi:hypothetical protein
MKRFTSNRPRRSSGIGLRKNTVGKSPVKTLILRELKNKPINSDGFPADLDFIFDSGQTAIYYRGEFVIVLYHKAATLEELKYAKLKGMMNSKILNCKVIISKFNPKV